MEPRARFGARLRAALPYAAAFVLGQTLAASCVRVSEPGLYALQAAILFPLALLLFAIPTSPRLLALAVVVATSLYHAAFAFFDSDHHLAALEGFQLLGLGTLLSVAGLACFGRASSTRASPAVTFAVTTLFQSLASALLLFPSIDVTAETRLAVLVWVATGLVPLVALTLSRSLPSGPHARLALASLAALCCALFVAAQPTFWLTHRLAPRFAPSAPPERADVLLIVLDTVRADHMSLYGYARPTTPALERFAERATLYERAQSQAIWTLPGHASLFTGLRPSEHQAEWKDGVQWVRKLWPEAITLAERFSADGYRTACLAANAFLAPPLGLSQGFQWLVTGRSPSVYLLTPALAMGLANAWDGPRARQHLGPLERTSSLHATEINRLALEWLTRAQNGPRLLVLNYMEAHDQLRRLACNAPRFGDGRSWIPDNLPEKRRIWEGQETLAPAKKQHLDDWYDSELACLDLHLGELFAELEARGLFERMLIAVTADHGHLLGEHGAFDHEAEVWRELTHVPLLVKGPNQTRGVRCTDPVETANLALVLPWLAGIDLAQPVPAEFGRADASHAARFAGRARPADPPCPLAPAAPVVSESPERFELAQWNPRYRTRWTALIDGAKKFFIDGAEHVQVVDLVAAGPEEPRTPTPEELARAKELLAAFRAERVHPLGPPSAEGASRSEEADEALRLLKQQGYAGD
jgi:arylsulfatase A-like enzyme